MSGVKLGFQGEEDDEEKSVDVWEGGGGGGGGAQLVWTLERVIFGSKFTLFWYQELKRSDLQAQESYGNNSYLCRPTYPTSFLQDRE